MPYPSINRIENLAHEVEYEVCTEAADELRDWIAQWEDYEQTCDYCKQELEDGQCTNELCPECPDYEEDEDNEIDSEDTSGKPECDSASVKPTKAV